MPTFEVKNACLAYALGSFALHYTTEDVASAYIDVGDSMTDDIRIRTGIGADTRVVFEYEGDVFVLERKTHGVPLPSHTNAVEYVVPERVVLTADSTRSARNVCSAAMHMEDNAQMMGKFRVYTYDARNDHWRRSSYIPNRDWDSIVLESSVRDALKKDVEDFRSDETRDWYVKNGVPYRRGYMFHGPPGTGKTSTIAALASMLNCNVYFINLVAPGLCDTSLSQAISSVRAGSIIVMEDIDCLFGTMREKKEDFCVTYSGLLNAIDGLTDPKGSLCIFTTNHPDRIESAMTRNGRIDARFEFKACDQARAKQMFLRFFPGAEAEAERFSRQLNGKRITPARLQEHFIQTKKCDAKDAIVMNISCDEKEASGGMWS